VRTPRSYHSLRTENAQGIKDTSPQVDQRKLPNETVKPGAEQAVAATGLNQVRGPSPGWTDVQRMDEVHGVATRYNNWLNPNAAARQNAHANPPAAVAKNDAADQVEQKKLGGKERLAAALQKAKESKPPSEPTRDPGRSR